MEVFADVCQQREQDDERAIATEDFLLTAQMAAVSAKLDDFLPPEIAEDARQAGEGVWHELRMMSYFLPTAATLIGGKVKVIGNSFKNDFSSRHRIFLALTYGEVSSGKTPVLHYTVGYLEQKRLQERKQFRKSQKKNG